MVILFYFTEMTLNHRRDCEKKRSYLVQFKHMYYGINYNFLHNFLTLKTFFSNSLVLDTERAKQFVAPLTMTADSIGISNGSARFISGLSTELFNKCYFLIADDKQVKLRKFYENILGMLCVKNSNCLTFYLSTHRQHLQPFKLIFYREKRKS